MTPDERAARIADARALLDMVEADESLPLPSELRHLGFYFRADGPGPEQARRQLAALEAALTAAGVALGEGQADENAGDWTVPGVMPGGVKVKVKAWLRHIAEEVTTVKETRVTEWHRLPAEGASESESGAAE